MKLMTKMLTLFISAALLAACGALSYKILPEQNTAHHFDINDPLLQEERDLLGLKDKEPVEWGLAISGGGIRSGTFAIGAIKQLEEAGWLPKMQMVSAVSGGGYPVYWWASNMMADSDEKNKRLGEKHSLSQHVLDSDGFLQHSCELMTRANFSISRASWKEMLLFPVASEYYRCSIERTFGYRDAGDRDSKGLFSCMFSDSDSYEIAKYKDLIEQRELPYFIFNATLDDEDEYSLKSDRIDMGWHTGLFEFTPLFAGNQAFGYKPWSEWPGKVKDNGLPLSQVSAISGAAARPLLKQSIDHPFTHKKAPDQLVLSDGGHSENLGAVALIRRGVKNIIVLDGEMDEDLSFEAYFILKDRLAAWGLTLENPLMDARKRIPDEDKFWLRENTPPLEKAAFKAIVKDNKGNAISTIYYLKMAIVGELKEDMQDQYAQSVKGMKMVEEPLSENAKIRAYLDKDENKIKGNWQCSGLNNNDFDYKKWIKQEAIYRANSEFSKNFPHYSTAVQSYYNDQLIAYIGLGYMQAKAELIPLLLTSEGSAEKKSTH